MATSDVPTLDNSVTNLLTWLSTTGLKIGLILLGLAVIRRVVSMILSRLVIQAIERSSFSNKKDAKQRAQTILSMVDAALHFIVWVVGIMVALSVAGVDLAALVAGAGAVAVVIGIGAQSAIKDIINGIYIVVENQFRVGDVVKLGDVSGTVERISLRSTVLRNIDGYVHHIPNGSIAVATNMTMGFSRVNLILRVAYDSDLDKVQKIVDQVGEELFKDTDWATKLTEAPHFLRINEFSDSAIEVKVTGKVMPGKQWAVAGELRRRLKTAFDKAGIKMPYVQPVAQSKVGGKEA